MYLSVRDRPDDGVDSPPSVGRDQPKNPRKSRVVGRNVMALGVTSMFTDISSEMVVAILPLYLTASMGLSTVAFGFFEGAYQLVGAICRLGGGAAADRTQNHKRIAASGYALSAATRVGLIAGTIVTVPVIPVLLLERVGKGIRSAPRDALISLSTAPHRLGLAFGVHRAMDTLGAMLGPFVAFMVLRWTDQSYQSIFVVSFAVAIVGVMVIVTFAESRPVPAARRERLGFGLGEIREAARQPGVRRIAVIAAGLGLVTVSDGFVFLVVQRHSELRLDLFPLLFAGTAVVYLLLAMPMGWLADRIGRRRVFVMGHAATLTLYVLLVFGIARYEVLGGHWILGCLGLLGIYYAATDGVLAAAVSGISDPALRSSAIAVVTVAAAMGGLVSAVSFGLVWSAFGTQRALLMVIALLVVAAPMAWKLLAMTEQESEPADNEEVRS